MVPALHCHIHPSGARKAALVGHMVLVDRMVPAGRTVLVGRTIPAGRMVLADRMAPGDTAASLQAPPADSRG